MRARGGAHRVGDHAVHLDPCRADLGREFVAEALGDLPRAALTIARQPDAPAMLDAVKSLLAGLPAA